MNKKRPAPDQRDMDAWDNLVDAIRSYIQRSMDRSKECPDMQPMIAALEGITYAVENVINAVIEKDGLRDVPYSKTWLIGVAYEWLEPLGVWRNKHFAPALSESIDRKIETFRALAREAEEEAREERPHEPAAEPNACQEDLDGASDFCLRCGADIEPHTPWRKAYCPAHL